MILLGEDSWKPAFGFLQTLPHMSVFDYALHPFMVVSHTRDMTIYLLGPLSPLRESPNLGGWSEGLDIQLQRKINTPSFKGNLRPMLKFALFRC